MNHEVMKKDLLEYQEEINFLVKSEIRLKILGILYNSPSTIKQIESLTGYSYSSIVDNINKLLQKNYIYNMEDCFHLHNTIKIKLTKMLYFNKAAKFLNEKSDFINKSHIDIRMDTIKDLSALEESQLIESDNLDLSKVSDFIQSSFMGFKFLKAIFPYYHPGYDEITRYVLEHECSVELILPDEVFTAGKNFISDYVSKNNKVKNNFIKYKPNDADIKFALIVTDKRIVLAFYTKEGHFNQNALLTSTNKEAIDFGLKLFEECENLCGDYVSIEDIINPN